MSDAKIRKALMRDEKVIYHQHGDLSQTGDRTLLSKERTESSQSGAVFFLKKERNIGLLHNEGPYTTLKELLFGNFFILTSTRIFKVMSEGHQKTAGRERERDMQKEAGYYFIRYFRAISGTEWRNVVRVFVI